MQQPCSQKTGKHHPEQKTGDVRLAENRQFIRNTTDVAQEHNEKQQP